MSVKERDGLDAFLFDPNTTELLNFKCFRGDREDVSEEDIKKQIHSALMQKKMKRARVSSEPPDLGVAQISVKDFVESLKREPAAV